MKQLNAGARLAYARLAMVRVMAGIHKATEDASVVEDMVDVALATVSN